MSTTAQDQKATFASNLRRNLDRQKVSRIFWNGVTIAAINSAAAFASEILNFTLEARGLNSRRVSIIVAPNPDKPRDARDFISARR